MPEGIKDKLTDADRAALAELQTREARRTRRTILHIEGQGELVEEHEQRECYTWSAPDFGTIVFDVRGIKDAILSSELEHAVYIIELDADWVEHLRTHGGVERARLAEVVNIDRPAIGLLFPDGTTVLIDGNHRIVRAWELGRRSFRVIMLKLLDITMRRKYCCLPGEERELFERNDPGMMSLATFVTRK